MNEQETELEGLAREVIRTRELQSEAEARATEAKAEATTARERLLHALQIAGLEGAELLGYKFRISSIAGVRVPDSPESREAFFNYLKERGIFEQMISVHSAKLNSWYNEELKMALENGQLDFSVPGVTESSGRVKLSINKAR